MICISLLDPGRCGTLLQIQVLRNKSAMSAINWDSLTIKKPTFCRFVSAKPEAKVDPRELVKEVPVQPHLQFHRVFFAVQTTRQCRNGWIWVVERFFPFFQDFSIFHVWSSISGQSFSELCPLAHAWGLLCATVRSMSHVCQGTGYNHGLLTWI